MSNRVTMARRILGQEWFELGREHYLGREYKEAIACFKQALDAPGYETPGRALNNMGLARARQHDYDGAIECYEKALQTPGFDASGYALNNLGWAYADKGDYRKAIDCYQRALLAPGYDSIGGTWNNIGIAWAELGAFDMAIAAYEQALGSVGYATPGNAWSNLAVALMHAGRLDDAAAGCRNALRTPGYDAPEVAWHNLGDIQNKQGDTQGAIKSWNRAIHLMKQKGRIGFARLVEGRVAELRAAISSAPGGARDPQATALAELLIDRASQTADGSARDAAGHHDAELIRIRKENLAAEITGIMNRNQNVMEGYCTPGAPGAPVATFVGPQIPEDCFINLKGWSSNVPLVAEVYRDRFGNKSLLGGGYFIDWHGRGIVVDPGINFVDNFHRLGGHITRIDLVLVTHGHIDHAHDLGTILDLQREYNKLVGEGKVAGKPLEIIYLLDRDTYLNGQDQLLAHLPPETQRELIASDQYDEHRMLKGFGLRIKPFPTAHDAHAMPNSVGLVLEFFTPGDPATTASPFRIGISSDTGLTDGVLDALRGCDAVVAHFNKTNAHDLLGTDPDQRHRHHLGYMGVRELFRNTRAGLCIAAEWSGEHGDIRFQVAELLKLELGRSDKAIVPAEIGLTFSIPGNRICCQACQGTADPEAMTVARPQRPFGRIMYYCPACLGGAPR